MSYLLPILVVSLACCALSKEYYITTNSSFCGTKLACFTLEELAQTDELANRVNLTLIFQPGEHALKLVPLFTIHNHTQVQMIGQKGSEISFYWESQIELSDIDQLSIEDLAFNRRDKLIPEQYLSIHNIQKLTIHNCYFTGLSTVQIADSYGNIVSLANIVTAMIKNTAFESNNGTALSVTDIASLSIESSTFIGNQGTFGGAVSIDSVYAVINNSLFDRNYATWGGAVLILSSGDVSISYSTLTGNSAENGGGIYVRSSWLLLSNSMLANNVGRYGGGIYVGSSDVFLLSSLLMNNSAADSGGGICLNSGSVSISTSDMISNSAEQFGGGIVVYSGREVSFVNSNLFNNSANGRGGGGVFAGSGNVSISGCNLTGNNGGRGGGLYVLSGNALINISNSVFTGNMASYEGGGICSNSDSVAVYDSTFSGNIAHGGGGGICVGFGNASVSNNTFMHNDASEGGGIIVVSGKVSISNCVLTGNRARFGAGLLVDSDSRTVISHSELTGNKAELGGGVHCSGTVNLSYSVLIDNWALGDLGGGGIYVLSGDLSVHHSSFTRNSAWYGAAVYLSSSNVSLLHSVLTGNNAQASGGGVYMDSSRAFISNSLFTDNNGGEYGGAIAALQSPEIQLGNRVMIRNNTARTGGGLMLTGSTLYVISPTWISQNEAQNEGGAIFCHQSIIEFNNAGNQTILMTNYATNGGGIYAIASYLKVSSFVSVQSNKATENGGGFYLKQSTNLYILKKNFEEDQNDLKVSLAVSNNTADFGGGIYVDDSTASTSACRTRATEGVLAKLLGECFIQTIRLYDSSHQSSGNQTINTFITNNTADKSGSAIYGGLLDRCTVSQKAELSIALSALEYVNSTVEVDIDKHLISSKPLQVILCNASNSSITRKGKPIRLHVKAIDQIGNTVNAIIRSTVVTDSGVGRLKEGQVEQRVGSECTELEYNVYSQDSSARVELYAEGPCTNLGISNQSFTVTFLECICSLGFHPSQSPIECRCECDAELQAAKCYSDEEIFEMDIDKGLWVGLGNFTEKGYVVHDCPFDYCLDQPANISLYSSDGQCAYNRSGVLCGECDEGLSLVFASSKCEECSNVFLLLLISFAVAGIALVVFILMLNLTIATGTTYGLMLYANILAANKAIFLPFAAPNFLTVFVSWVNLDLGIETCFYDGMDSQAKVLLQLVFPAYLFLLIILIIILSMYVNSFAKFLSNRNPVAALCTLVILSYSKLLRLIISALQFTFLGSHEIVWVYDGNVQYFSLSHIPRFIAAAVILTGCVLFTTLLFFGQWFSRCSEWYGMKWTKNTKYIGFMDAFHAPFTPKHRYWVGLLLFALIAHNFAASMAPDTSIPVLSAGCVSIGLVVYKSLMNRVYKNKLNNALETLFLLNIAILSLATYHLKTNSNIGGQLALAYVSMSIAFILFIVIVCYQFYKYIVKKTTVWDNQMRPLDTRRFRFNFHRNRNYRHLVEEDEINLPAIADVPRYEEQDKPADKYNTPPKVTIATKLDQLREPALDELAPVTADDYRQAPVSVEENQPRPCTTTVVDITQYNSDTI